METDRFTLEYFCRLCASEGVIIHPLFPPGDDDPKDELVRMIDVLTSVHLTRPDDAGAVICDKCLQMLDLFCRFREECLRQDVLIRTKRTLLSEELVRQQQQQQQQQQLLEQHQREAELLLLQQQEALLRQQTPVEVVKLESEDEETNGALPIVLEGPVDEKLQVLPTPHAIAECKQEGDGEEVAEQLEAQPILYHDSDDIATGDDEAEYDQCGADDAIEESCRTEDTFSPSNGIALFTPAGSLSISVQVNQMSLGGPAGGTGTTVSGLLVCGGGGGDGDGDGKPDTTSPIPIVAKPTFRRSKPNLNKPPPGCDVCQESFATHYDYEQHMDRQHAWDKGRACSLACEPCQMRFTKSYNLKRHMYEVHGELAPGMSMASCPVCGERYLHGYTLDRHIAKMHRNKKKLKIIAIK